MKVDVYSTVVFLHVVSAILATGPLFILMPIIKRLRGVEIQIEEIYLTIINVIIRLVMHAGHALVFTGVLLIIIGPWSWYTSWVVMTVFVMGLSAVFLATGFTRVLRVLNTTGTCKNELLNRLNRTSWIYITLMLIMLWLMVQKPIIW